MLAYTYVSKGNFQLIEKPEPTLQNDRDAIVRVTLASICTSDLHIKHGSVPRAVPGITVGHEMVGVVEQVGSAVHNCPPGGPGGRQCGDLLRRVLLLPPWLGQQLYRSQTAAGPWAAASTADRRNTSGCPMPTRA